MGDRPNKNKDGVVAWCFCSIATGAAIANDSINNNK
jgi:hypothetical protein